MTAIRVPITTIADFGEATEPDWGGLDVSIPAPLVNGPTTSLLLYRLRLPSWAPSWASIRVSTNVPPSVDPTPELLIGRGPMVGQAYIPITPDTFATAFVIIPSDGWVPLQLPERGFVFLYPKLVPAEERAPVTLSVRIPPAGSPWFPGWIP